MKNTFININFSPNIINIALKRFEYVLIKKKDKRGNKRLALRFHTLSLFI